MSRTVTAVTTPTTTTPISALWLGIGLVFAVWLTRLIAIEQFPFFIDEGLHVYFSEVTLQTHPVIYGNKYYLFSIWWWSLFQSPYGEPIWLSRVVTLLAVLPGVAAVIALGRLSAGVWGAALGGLLYLFSTYHLFFERIAMADPISGSAVLLAVYFAYRLTRRVRLTDALLTGLAVFLAIGAKLSALPYLGIPVAAVLTLGPAGGASLRDRLRWFGVAMATQLTLLAIFVGALVIARRNPFANAAGHVRYGENGLLDTLSRIPGSAVYIGENLTGFIGVGGLLLVGLALIYLLWRRQFYLLLVFLAPTPVFLLSEMQSSRYYAAPLTVLLVCLTVALALFTRARGRRAIAVTVTALSIYAGVGWLPFLLEANADPLGIDLPARDYREYVAGDASGFGLQSVYDALHDHEVERVIGILANCQSLRYLTTATFPVECPQINPDGRSIVELNALMEASRAEGVFVVLEDIDYLPPSAPGALIATIDDPSGRPRLSVYDLAPAS